MAKQSTKSPVKKTSKKTAEEKPRSTVKEYSFFQDVYEVVRQIPKGRVTSYGAIAAYLGTKLSARMVGWAMNAAGAAKPKVPAQRVVNWNVKWKTSFWYSHINGGVIKKRWRTSKE